MYVTGNTSDVGVLYLTDVFGIQLLENRLFVAMMLRLMVLINIIQDLRIASDERAILRSRRICSTAHRLRGISTGDRIST